MTLNTISSSTVSLGPLGSMLAASSLAIVLRVISSAFQSCYSKAILLLLLPLVLNMTLSSTVIRPLGSSVTIVLRHVGSAFQSYSTTILNTAITLSHAKYDLGLNGEPSLG